MVLVRRLWPVTGTAHVAFLARDGRARTGRYSGRWQFTRRAVATGDPHRADHRSLGKDCLYRQLDSTVMVMKSAEDRHRCDAAYVLDGAIDRSA
jgi:hypothetical protein